MSIESIKPSIDPLAEARRLLEEERQAREKRCLEEVGQVLERHNCGLSVHLRQTPEGAFVPVIGVRAIVPFSVG